MLRLNRKGQTLVEYVLIISLVTVIAIAAVKIFGGYLKDSVTKMSCSISDKEYVEGMTSFITEIGSKQFTAEESDLGEYHEKLGVAKEKDSDFINSIYGGSLNKPESMPIKEAVENIEYLIDFIPEIGSIHDKCVTLKDTYEGMDNNILNESLSMLYESVENYCYSTVSSIASTYHNIKKTLQDGPVQESTQETFKLF